MSGKEVVGVLKKNGWALKRVKGSHHIMGKGTKIVSVPVHGSRDLGVGFLNGLQKLTGVKLKK